MFVNSYQNGYYTQVWDSRVNVDKNPFYKQLFKKVPGSLKNYYDKDVKSFIYQLQGNQRLCFPSDDKSSQLSLHQRYAVLQIFIPIGSNWSIQLGVNDLNGNKKRINITTMQGKQQLKYFSFRYPLEQGVIQKDTWMFLAIDLYSFANVFKNSVFRSLDSIVVCSSCKIRRIFTMRQWNEFEIPKTYWLPTNIHQILQLIEFKQTKQSSIITQSNLINSSMQYSKMIESKMIDNQQHSILRNSQKTSPFQDKIGGKQQNIVKFPSLNKNLNKQQTPLKSSKLSDRIDLSHKELNKALVGKSDRSLTKAEMIIQKSKLRLNTLQQKQDEILKRLKSQDHRFSDKVSKNQKQKAKLIKNQNLFKSDLFKSQQQSSGIDSKISKFSRNHSPKALIVRKNFEQDNIFKQESYSSSWSRLTEKERHYLKGKGRRQQQKRIEKGSQLKNSINTSSREQSTSPIKRQPPSHPAQSRALITNSTPLQRQQIIQQDLWTDQQQQQQQPKRSQTPIQQVIQSHQLISTSLLGQTLITKQNNKPVIMQQKLNSLQHSNQLELIYDEMIGCYYHPQTNTYYEIKK